MKKCPICKSKLNKPVPDFCETCGWELRNDLTLVPSLDLREREIEDYKNRTAVAKRNWMRSLEISRRLDALEKTAAKWETIWKDPFENNELMQVLQAMLWDVRLPLLLVKFLIEILANAVLVGIETDEPFRAMVVHETERTLKRDGPIKVLKKVLGKAIAKNPELADPINEKLEEIVGVAIDLTNENFNGEGEIKQYLEEQFENLKKHRPWKELHKLKEEECLVLLSLIKSVPTKDWDQQDAICYVLCIRSLEIMLSSKYRPGRLGSHDGSSSVLCRGPVVFIDWTPRALPILIRDPFETLKDFEKRINGYPPVPAGKCTLLREKYDIDTGRFPIEIAWRIKSELLAGFSAKDKFLHIVAERDLARAIWESGESHTVVASLFVHEESVVFHDPMLIWENRKIRVQPSVSDFVEPVSGMQFVYVPGGTLEMLGVCLDGNACLEAYKIRIDPFFIGKYPVTNAQYRKVTGCNKLELHKMFDHPVGGFSWNDAKRFIEILSEKNGYEYHFCLPSEAQWEYAARSGENMLYDANGKNMLYDADNDADEAIGDVDWRKGNSDDSDRPVGLKKPNKLGICDMIGNVWELCEDDWHDFDDLPMGGSAWVKKTRGSKRVARGGIWSHSVNDFWTNRGGFVGARGSVGPDKPSYDIGVRLVFLPSR